MTIVREERFLTHAELAREMKCSEWYVSMMKKAGYQFCNSRWTKVSHAREWLEANPDFKTTKWKMPAKRSQVTPAGS